MKRLFLTITMMGFIASMLPGNAAAVEAEDSVVVKLEAKVTDKVEKSADKKKESKKDAKKEGESAAAVSPSVIVIPAHKPADVSQIAKEKKGLFEAPTAGSAKKAAVVGRQSVSENLKGESQKVSSTFENNFKKIYGISSSDGKGSSSNKT